MIELKILATPGCAPCKVVEGIATKLRGEFPHLRVEKIDLMEHPEVAAKYGVVASPTMVINDTVVFVGLVSEARLRAKLEEIERV